MQIQNNPVNVRGFYRVQILEGERVVGDSGVLENTIVNLGFNDYLVKTLGALAGSKQIGYAGLGTGGAPATGDTSLTGETDKRTSVTAATSSTSKALRFTATFGSSDSFVTATRNISNVGLFASSTGGTLFSGNTFASSSCATNQDVRLNWRPLLVTACQKPAKFGEHLFETIPSQAGGLFLGLWACVETRGSAPTLVG